MILAAEYARYSPGPTQREESITAQRRAIAEYAKRHDMQIVRTYIDEAQTGTNDEREQFQAMISDARLGLFQALLVHKVDRFARDRFDSAIYKRELKRCGVSIYFVAQNIDDSPESIFLEAVLEGQAEYFSRNLAKEVMKGLRENALSCRHCGGIPPLGYDVDQNLHYVINDSEAKIVRYIFERSAQGASYVDLINELMARGWRTKRNQPFSKNSLHDLLRNPKYKGEFVFNAAAKKVNGKKNHRTKKDPSQVIVVPRGIPQIVDTDTWDRVQNKMDDNKRLKRWGTRAKEIYVLTGKIFCGDCGAAMVGNSGYCSDKVKRYSYYECNKRDRAKTCSNKRIRKSDVENMVIQQIETSILNPDHFIELSESLYKLYIEQFSSYTQDIEDAEARLAAIKKETDNLMDLVVSGFQKERCIAKLGELEVEEKALTHRLSDIATAMKSQYTQDDFLDFLHDMHRRLKSGDPEDYRYVLDALIHRITIYGDKVDIELEVNFGYAGSRKSYHASSEIKRPYRARALV